MSEEIILTPKQKKFEETITLNLTYIIDLIKNDVDRFNTLNTLKNIIKNIFLHQNEEKFKKINSKNEKINSLIIQP
jgi:predicted metallopeptidase